MRTRNAVLAMTVVAVVAAGLAVAGVVTSTSANPVTKPVTKGLRSGAIYQAPLGARSCYAAASSVKLASRRCTLLAQLKGVDITVRPAVAPDSKALYLPSQGGLVVLKRGSNGALAFGQCIVLAGPCGVAENDEGARVSQAVIGPDGHQLYVLLERAQTSDTEIHALTIGSDDRLATGPQCTLLTIASPAGIPTPNPRNCRVAAGDNHIGAYGLVLTPNGRFAYVMASSQSGVGIVELVREADGALSAGPGCVSTDGRIGFGQPGACQTILPQTSSGQNINLDQLVAAPDSSSLIARGQDQNVPHVGGFLVRFAIDANGGLIRSTAPSGCVNPTGASGCAHSALLLGLLSDAAFAGRRLYIGSSSQRPPLDRGIFASTLLGYELGSDGGLSLPAGASGCSGNVTEPLARIKKLAPCSMGHEAMRHPASVVAGPGGKTVYVVGFMQYDSRAIAPFRVGVGGAPSPVSGTSGCFVDGSIFAAEKTRCNRPFAVGTLTNSPTTFVLTPDGRAAYVLDQAQATDFARLNVLVRRP